jgi:glycogen synthase
MSALRRILMTADTLGGVWTYALELASGLREKGIEVAIATMGSPLSVSQQQQAARRALTIYESDFKLEWMENPWRDVDAAGEWLLELDRQFGPDVVHLNNYAHGNLPFRCPVLVVGHSCVYSWWQAVHKTPPPGEWSDYRTRVSAGLRGAGRIASVSQAMLEELEYWYGARGGSVIYNGQHTCAYAARPKQDFVLSTGRLWDAAKNIDTLDAAARSVVWPVYVAGEAQHPEGGMKHFGNVHPIGHLASSELRDWFTRASIYALPALYEPFGLSVLEAALSECALVLGDIPSLREIWGDAALFVTPLDAVALAETINELIACRANREELGRRARARAMILTTEHMIRRYLDLYRELVTQPELSNTTGKEAWTSCVW